MAEIELHPGTPFCSAAELNRIARQQGLCLAIAQASIFDEICQAMPLPEATEAELVQRYLEQNDCAVPKNKGFFQRILELLRERRRIGVLCRENDRVVSENKGIF